MAPTRWRRGRASLRLGVALATFSAPAFADVSLTPAADGSLGAFLVSGPVPAARAKTLDPASVHASAGPGRGPRFSLIFAGDGALDLDKQLGTDRKAGAFALLAGTLRLKEDLDGWLLASIDGRADLFVDGKRVWSRTAAHLRGQALDAIPLALGAGDHELALKLEHPGSWWALELRLLDRRDLLPPRGASLVLPGLSDADEQRLRRELLTATLDLGLDASGYRPHLLLEYRRGAPFTHAPLVSVELRSGKTKPLALGVGGFPVGARGVSPLEVSLPPLSTRDLAAQDTIEVRAKLEGVSLDVKAAASNELPPLVARAKKLGERARAHALSLADAETIAATLETAVSDVRRGGPSKKSGLEKLVSALEAGRDPMSDHGVVRLARRSPVDGEPDPIDVQVPAGYEPGTKQRFPLVVALHGLNGNPDGIMDAFLDSRSVAGFVAAPYAHGNAFYRGPGELEVMAAVDWMKAHYPIDPERVSITGVSMGGTGTAHIALWYADRFSAAAPLCGYQSYFVRRDTAKRPIRAWETERMQHWSPTSFAERGRNLPMWVAHGTKDFPLENSRVLVNRYKELGFAMTDEWPDTGHAVWTKAYAGARLYPWLSGKRHDPAPAEVRVKADQLRFGKVDWLTLTGLAHVGHAGLVSAKVESPSQVVVTTESAEGFEIERRAPRIGAGAVSVAVDGATLEFAAKEPIRLHFEGKSWKKGAPRANGKRAGHEGPIRDAYLEPLIFVYGTLDPRTALANREVAEAFAHVRPGPDVAYRVIPDRDLDPATEASHAVFAVGSEADHLLLAQVGRELPIRVEPGALRIASERQEKPGTGAIFITENPRHRERYLVVVTGVDAAGIWRALSLPQLLPDFVVYDDALAPASGEVVLGADAHVVAAGFFDRDWKLPKEIRDTP
jgi:predicted esterase